MYKRCINNNVDGLTLNKVYYIDEDNVKDGAGITKYIIKDDYDVFNEFRADRFIDVEEYKFELWHCLDLELNNLYEQATNILNSLDCVYDKNYSIDDEGILKTTLTLFDIKEIQALRKSLDDDIVIYGDEYYGTQILMTKTTMCELGLD
jgi:hypothetical protein